MCAAVRPSVHSRLLELLQRPTTTQQPRGNANVVEEEESRGADLEI